MAREGKNSVEEARTWKRANLSLACDSCLSTMTVVTSATRACSLLVSLYNTRQRSSSPSSSLMYWLMGWVTITRFRRSCCSLWCLLSAWQQARSSALFTKEFVVARRRRHKLQLQHQQHQTQYKRDRHHRSHLHLYLHLHRTWPFK